MKNFLLLVSIGLALATPYEKEVELDIKPDILIGTNNPIVIKEVEMDAEVEIQKYPQVIKDTKQLDISKLSIEALLEEAVHHPGMEFLNDPEAAASMGIDPMNIDPELIADAFSTTVG